MRLDAAHAQGPGPSFPLVPPYLFFLVSVLTQEKTVYDSQLHLKRHSHKEEGGGGVLMKCLWGAKMMNTNVTGLPRGSSAVYRHRPMPVSVPAELEASLDEREARRFSSKALSSL